MRQLSRLAIAVGFLATAWSQASQAALIVTAGVDLGAQSGSVLENFDRVATGFSGSTTLTSGINLNITPGAQVVQGDSVGAYLAPVLSGNSGAGFGSANQAAGTDRTSYLAVGTNLGGNAGAAAEFILPTLAQSFGLLWGSVDSYNSLALYNGSTLIGTVSGSDVLALTGGRTTTATAYVNIQSDLVFNRVVATSAGNAFEIDNVSFTGATPAPAAVVAVPEPASLLLRGAGLLALGVVRRRPAPPQA